MSYSLIMLGYFGVILVGIIVSLIIERKEFN
jgi:hypothetical protein